MLVWGNADTALRCNPLYNFIKNKVEKSKYYRVDRLEHGLLDTITTQHFNIIWIVQRYTNPTPLLRRAIAGTVLRCINIMFDRLRYTYLGWTFSDFNEYDYRLLHLIMNSTITYYMRDLLSINRYDPTTGFDHISPPALL